MMIHLIFPVHVTWSMDSVHVGRHRTVSTTYDLYPNLEWKKHRLVPCVFTRILLGFCLPNMQNPDVWFKVILFGGLVTSPFLLGEVLVSLHLFESLFDHGFVRLPDNFEGI